MVPRERPTGIGVISGLLVVVEKQRIEVWAGHTEEAHDMSQRPVHLACFRIVREGVDLDGEHTGHK